MKKYLLILDWDVTIYQTRFTLGKATFQNVKNILLFKLKEIICGWPVDACWAGLTIECISYLWLLCCPAGWRTLTLKLSEISTQSTPWKFEQAQNFGKVGESGCPMKVDLVLVVNKQSDLGKLKEGEKSQTWKGIFSIRVSFLFSHFSTASVINISERITSTFIYSHHSWWFHI